MIQTANGRFAKRGAGDCLTDAQLQALLDNRSAAADEALQIAHLDNCPSCQSRLQQAAGDAEEWSSATRHLQDSTRTAADSRRLLKELRGSRAARAEADREGNECALLDPCEKPDCLGRLDSYEVREVLGSGGMGVVFRAYDPSLNREVAIKVIRSPLADQEKVRKRFQREARAAAAIRNEHVAAIYAIEETGARPYLVMECVQGASLAQRLQVGRRLSWREIVRIGAEVARGLAAAHAAGLIHRDIKPANILIEEETGRVKISDFGLARSLEDAGLTHGEYISGTPEFIAPEQAAGVALDPRADLFSLGAVLYAMCTDRPPFAADNTLAVLRRTREEAPAPISQFRPDLPEPLVRAIDRLLAKDPHDRFTTAADAAEALEAVLNGDASAVSPNPEADCQPATRRSRAAWLSIAAAILVMLGLGLSEVSGVTGFLAAGGNEEKSDEDKEAVSAQALVEETEETPRVQVVTPESVLRDAIQEQKDQVEHAHSPELVRTFNGHTGPVNGLAFPPGGEQLLSASGWPIGDRTVRLWNVESGEQVRRFNAEAAPAAPHFSGPREAPGEFQTLAVSPDGSLAVTGGTGGAVCVWNVETGQLVRTFDGHTATVYAADISPEGERVLTGGRDGVALLWNLKTGDELLRMPISSMVKTVAFSPDGERALTGGADGVLRLWDLAAAKEQRRFQANDKWVNSAVFLPGGERAAAAHGSDVYLWDLNTGKRLGVLSGHRFGVIAIDISPDGRRLASCGYDSRVRLWDIDEQKQSATFLGHRGWIWSVTFSPDGRYLASAGGGRYNASGVAQRGADHAIRLWKLPPVEPRVAEPDS